MKELYPVDATKMRISEALIDLMRTNDFHSITVTDLVREADISRATFYRHFDGKVQVVHYYFDCLVRRFKINEHMSADSMEEYYESIKYVFDVIKKNKRLLRIVVNADFGSIILKYIDDRYTRPYQEAGVEKIPLYLYVFSGGVYNVVLKWLDEDCVTPSDELAKIIVSLTPYEFIKNEKAKKANKG